VFLAALISVGGLPMLRDRALGTLAALVPTPTATLPPGADLFYFVPGVPWGTVSLDGRSLSHVPLPGNAHPLRLTRGRHQLAWLAAPFQPLQCILTVPRARTDTCPVTAVRLSLAGPQQSIITMHQSLAALSPGQRAALTQAVQAALTTLHLSATVQPGERYYYYFGAGEHPKQYATTATEPLRAELTFQPILGQGEAEPCVRDPGIQPCYFSGQDCGQICTVAQPAGSDASTSAEWIAAVLVRSTWNYQRLDGTSLTLLDDGVWQPRLNFYAVVLRISWESNQWHVTPILGHSAALPLADEIVCAPARDLIAQGPLRATLSQSDPNAQLQFASGPNPAEGCAVTLSIASSTSTQPTAATALFLERFGGLLAANATAHGLWPALPLANSYEQSLAQQMAG
jgi:hypothetical protein